MQVKRQLSTFLGYFLSVAATVADDFCFALNSEGKEGANCGKSEQGSYKGCARQ